MNRAHMLMAVRLHLKAVKRCPLGETRTNAAEYLAGAKEQLAKTCIAIADSMQAMSVAGFERVPFLEICEHGTFNGQPMPQTIIDEVLES